MHRLPPTATGILFAACCLVTAPLGCGGDDTNPTADTAGDTTTADDTADPGEDVAATDTNTPPACNPILQTGCEADENCTFGPSDTTPSCVPEGEVAYGDECGGADRCERGVCLSINDTGNRCYKFCQTVAHCDAQRACLTLTSSPFRVCEIPNLYESCDLLAQDCTGGKGCYVVANEPTPICLPAGTSATGTMCDNAAGCIPGNVCINQRCKRLCDNTAVDPCGGFTPCTAWAGDVGYCDE